MGTPPATGVHGVRIGVHFNTNEYMHEQTTIGFGVHISNRKYLNWCTPFSDVSQWYIADNYCHIICQVNNIHGKLREMQKI